MEAAWLLCLASPVCMCTHVCVTHTENVLVALSNCKFVMKEGMQMPEAKDLLGWELCPHDL